MGVVRIVLTGDNHINRYSDRMSPQKLEERRRTLRKSFKRTIDYAVSKQAHLYLHVGDLFDTPSPRNLELYFAATMMNELKSHGIEPFFISGNHDTPKQRTEEGGILPHQVFDTLGGISLFSRANHLEIREIKASGFRVAIGGLSFNPLLTDEDNPLEGINYHSDADIRVMLLHYSLSGHVYPSANEPIINLDSIDRVGDIQLLCVGHVHKYSSFQVGKMQVIIPGTTERLSFDETETSGFVYIEMNKNGVQNLEYIPIEAQPRQVLTIRTKDLDLDIGNPTEYIIELLLSASATDKILRLKLEGHLSRDLFHQIEYKRIYEIGSNSNFFFELDESELYLEDEQTDFEPKGARVSLLETLLGLSDEKLSVEHDDSEKELLFECKKAIRNFFDRENR